jgi:hypothetical protein
MERSNPDSSLQIWWRLKLLLVTDQDIRSHSLPPIRKIQVDYLMYHSGQEVEDALVEVAEVEEVAPEEEEEEEEVAAALVEAAEVLAEEVEAVLAGEAALAEAEAEAEQGFLPRDAEWKLLIFRRLYF